MIITISSRIHRAITHLSRTSSFVPAHPHGGYGMGGGWVGGWVGGIMTFGTTTAHIVSVDDHHDFITHSSCHYSPLTHFIIRLRTYAWRVWYGGGGGWVSMEIFGNTYTPGSGAAIAAWIFGKAFLTCSMPKKGLASSVRRLIN